MRKHIWPSTYSTNKTPICRRVIQIFIFSLPIIGSSQINLHYFDPNLPQSNFLNPSNQSKCRTVIGVPFLNSLQFQAANSNFTFNQFVHSENTSKNSFLDNTLNQVKDRNFLESNLDISSFFISLNRNNRQLNFAIRDRVNLNLFYSKDILKFITKGNSAMLNESISMDDLLVSLNYMRQYSFGYVKRRNHRFSYGMHLNILYGKSNFFLNPKKIDVFTDEETFHLYLDTELSTYSSMPFSFLSKADEPGFNTRNISTSDFLFNNRNLGFSIDYGLTYRYNYSISFYLSILDIGFIKNKTYVHNFELMGNLNYYGIPLDASSQVFNSIFSSIDDNPFIFSESNKEPYTYFLPTRIYCGARKTLNEKHRVAALYNVSVQRLKFKNAFHLISYYQFTKGLTTMTSWSWSKNSLKNIGAGLSWNIYPLNIYLLSDNVGTVFWPFSTKNLNLQFGINLKWGCSRHIKKKKNCGCNWNKQPKENNIYITKPKEATNNAR